MTVWTSFMDLAHWVGAVGSTLLVAGFTAQGEGARAVFYALIAAAFTTAILRRRRGHEAALTPAAVDLRTTAAPVETLTATATATATGSR